MNVPGDLLRRQSPEILPRPRLRPVDLALDRKVPLLQGCAWRRTCREDGEALQKVLARRDSDVALSPRAPASKAAGDEPSTHECTSYRRASPGLHPVWHAAEDRVNHVYLRLVMSSLKPPVRSVPAVTL